MLSTNTQPVDTHSGFLPSDQTWSPWAWAARATEARTHTRSSDCCGRPACAPGGSEGGQRGEKVYLWICKVSYIAQRWRLLALTIQKIKLDRYGWKNEGLNEEKSLFQIIFWQYVSIKYKRNRRIIITIYILTIMCSLMFIFLLLNELKMDWNIKELHFIHFLWRSCAHIRPLEGSTGSILYPINFL